MSSGSWRQHAAVTLYVAAAVAAVGPLVASASHGVVVATIGHNPIDGDLVGNQGRLAALIQHAASLRATVVVLPERAATGSSRGSASHDVAEVIPGPTSQFLGDQARRHSVWLSASLIERAASGEKFVTAVLLGPDGRIHQQSRKVLVRDDVDGGVSPGSFRAVVDSVDARGLRLGIASIGDVHSAVPRLAQRGARAVLINADVVTDAVATAKALEDLAATSRTTLLVAGPDCQTLPCITGAYGAGAVSHRYVEGSVHVARVQRESAWVIGSRPGLPTTVPVPTIDSGNAALAELGRQLFVDPQLSSTGDVSCVTCHDPQRAFTNGLPRGVGVHGRQTKRNVPSLLNVAFKPLLQWDGYASSIENFVKYPFSGSTEMDFHYLDKVVPYVRGRADYAGVLRRNLRIEQIEFEHIATALASYQRTLLSGNAPFDRYHYGGERAALSAAAARGLRTFIDRGCAACHTIGGEYALFTDMQYHDLGVGYDPTTGKYQDIGLGGISTNDFSGKFLTPSLRNVAVTAPYMHDGSLPTLEAVLDLYARGLPGTAKRPDRLPIRLSTSDRADLIAFLESLTGEERYTSDGRRTRADGATSAGARQ